MARINIEDSLFKDVRFDDLKIKLGSVDTALGAMVRAWSLAQKWYLKEETSRLIPITEWKKQRISDSILEVGLAEMRGDFIYVSGSDEQFVWLIQRQAAGKKGGRPSDRNKPTKKKAPDKVPLPAESGSNPLSLSLSPSLSLTHTTASTSEIPTIAKDGDVLEVVDESLSGTEKKTSKKQQTQSKQVTTPEELEKEIGPDGINKLLSMFERDHINTEFPYMAEWLSANRRKQKNYTLFVMNWLKRSKAEFEARKRTQIDYNASMRMK